MSSKTNIEFEHLRYVVQCGVFRKKEKQILNNVNGEFRSCELSAIIGPSGCGKTSLLNILSGFVNKNVFGSIRINGEERNEKLFKKQSTYIMQEENLHLLLTVNEAMSFAIKLKTGNALAKKHRKAKIMSVLKTLGLDGKLNEYSRDLSGGEQKRLSIALELVDDPSILFLDEPTTGLDSSSSTQCIQLLKKLAQQGKTIVCTVHTPSAILFGIFDQLYALAEGQCIYQGSSRNLVPFLKELDLICPETFNPADFLLEIATNAYGAQNSRLVKKISNGLNEQYRCANNNNEDSNVNDVSSPSPCDRKTPSDIRSHYSSSFFSQLVHLMLRNFLFLKRDPMLMLIRVVVHLVVGLMVGFLYFNIGQQADQIFNIYRFVAAAVGFLAYAGYYSLMMRFPLDMTIIKREHFNRWYSTGAYYLSILVSDIPITITCTSLYLTLIYFLTDQPPENFRFLLFLLIGTLTSFAAQSWGLLIGSLFSVQTALSAAALLMAANILTGGFFIATKDIPESMEWQFEATYLKHSIDGIGSLIFGFNRTKLQCSEIYCHFESPQKFMSFIGLKENLEKSISALACITLAVHITTYYVMRYRLKS